MASLRLYFQGRDQYDHDVESNESNWFSVNNDGWNDNFHADVSDEGNLMKMVQKYDDPDCDGFVRNNYCWCRRENRKRSRFNNILEIK